MKDAPTTRRLVPRWLAAGIVVLPFALAAFGVVTALLGHDAWFSEEDGPAENTQVGICLVASVVAGLVARHDWQAGDRVLALFYVGLALALFFVAGEEISWGQRLFGFATPAEVASVNLQGELTLHNTSLFTRLFHLAEIAIGVAGSVLPLVRWPAMPAWAERLRTRLVPPAMLIPYFALPALWRVYRYVHVAPGAPPWVARYSEVMELILYSSALLFVALQLRGIRIEEHSPALAARPRFAKAG